MTNGSFGPRRAPGSSGDERQPELAAHANARTALGKSAEDLAAEYLEQQGLSILLRNYRRKSGELDIVARKDDVLVIGEVRTRSNDAYGGAAASVDGWKRHKIIRAATQLLQQRRELAQLRARFDVLIVHDPGKPSQRVEWIQHAFEA